jgi:hypothetical protein
VEGGEGDQQVLDIVKVLLQGVQLESEVLPEESVEDCVDRLQLLFEGLLFLLHSLEINCEIVATD